MQVYDVYDVYANVCKCAFSILTVYRCTRYTHSILLDHIPVSKLEEGALLPIHLEWKGLLNDLIEDTFDATIETMHQSITWDANTRLYYGTSGGVTEAQQTNDRFGKGPHDLWMILDVYPAVCIFSILDGLLCFPC